MCTVQTNNKTHISSSQCMHDNETFTSNFNFQQEMLNLLMYTMYPQPPFTSDLLFSIYNFSSTKYFLMNLSPKPHRHTWDIS